MKENRVYLRKSVIIILIFALFNIYATAYKKVDKRVFLTNIYLDEHEITDRIKEENKEKEEVIVEEKKETDKEELVENNKKTTTTPEKKETTTTKKVTTTTNKTTTPVKKETKAKATPTNKITVNGVLSKTLMKDEKGDNYYLNHNLNGVEDNIGVPYMDFRTDFSTRKIIVYAHSSPNGNGPFQGLQNYHNNKSFYNNHKYIEIEYDGKKYKYEIFSVYIAAAVDKDSDELEYFYKMNYSDSAWEETINKYKSKSEYDTGVTVSKDDKIIILQTCSMDKNYYRKYYRYNLLVMGKLFQES